MTGPTDITGIAAELATFWRGHGYQVALAAAASVVLLTVTWLVAGRIIRATRGASGNAKLTVGTAVVQAGVTWVVVTGTYVFCTRIFQVPTWEAVAFAAFFEAATWVSIGMIRAHAKDGKEGFGPAGPFFWIFSTLGGLLAVIGGDTPGAKTGRAVVVVIGACLWYLTLLRWIKRSGKPGTFRWTPRRLLVAIGAIEPGDHDVADENREWQVRRLARAMRWAASGRPWRWLGRRALIRRGEATQEDIIAEARRRYAVTYLLTTTCAPDSDVMRRVIADVKSQYGVATPPANEPATVATGEPAAKPASGTGWPPATAVAVQPVTKPAKVATAKTPVVPVTELPESARQIAKLRAKNPKLTQAQVVEKTGISERTVQRHWAATTPAVEPATTPVNGTPVPDLITATGGQS